MLTDAKFVHFIWTFGLWLVVYLLVCIISRFFLVKNNPLNVARDMLNQIIKQCENMQKESLTINTVKLPMKKLRYLIKVLIKMLALYQYDNPIAMEFASIKADASSMQGQCNKIMEALLDGDKASYNSILVGLKESCLKMDTLICEREKQQERKAIIES